MSGQEVTEGIPKECGQKLVAGTYVIRTTNNEDPTNSNSKWVTECISKLKEKADAQSQGERKVEQTIVGASTGVAGLGAGIATGLWLIPKVISWFK